MNDSCNCRVCRDHRRWSDVLIDPNDDGETAKMFDEVMTRLESAESDLSWYRALFDGSWPQAEEILRNQLEHVRAKANPGGKP
jgi:hypothetical protein